MGRNTKILMIQACFRHHLLVFPSEFYITMVKWVTKERLSVRWVNRAQNMSILSLCDVTQDICTKVRNLIIIDNSLIFKNIVNIYRFYNLIYLFNSETCDDIGQVAGSSGEDFSQ